MSRAKEGERDPERQDPPLERMVQEQRIFDTIHRSDGIRLSTARQGRRAPEVVLVIHCDGERSEMVKRSFESTAPWAKPGALTGGNYPLPG